MGWCSHDSDEDEVENVPHYKNRPEPLKHKDRKCRDVLWIFLFALYWAGMGVVTWYSVFYGNLDRLASCLDSEGNLCSSRVSVDSTRDLSDRPYLYFFNLSAIGSTYKVCVSSCPSITLDPTRLICLLFRCIPKVVLDGAQALTNFTQNGNISISFPVPSNSSTINITEGVSIPNPLANVDTSLWSQSINVDLYSSTSLAMRFFQGLADTWWIVLVSCGFALIASFIWLVLLQYLAGVMIWISLILVILASLALTAVLFINYYAVSTLRVDVLDKFRANSAAVSDVWNAATVDQNIINEITLLVMFIVSAAISITLLFLVVCCRRRINNAIDVISEASSAMKSMCTIIFFPVYQYVFVLGIVAWFAFIFALISTSGSLLFCYALISEISSPLQSNRSLPYLQIYCVFGFFWTHNFVLAITRTTIAGAISSWYWTKGNPGPLPVTRSLVNVLVFHLGSMAFGAFLLGLTQALRWIIMKLRSSFSKSLGGNQILKLACCCCLCVVECAEKCLKIVTKSAYIEIGVKGYGFCKAARKSFFLIVRNAMKSWVLDRISDLIIFLGKLAITFSSTVSGLVLMVYALYGGNFNSAAFVNYAIPTLQIILIFSYVIASMFMSIFETAIDTIFFCTCELRHFWYIKMTETRVKLGEEKERNIQSGADDKETDKWAR
ncbi:plasma-membrane choline transporter-domain-containing protein [Cladochytrium replicatum]|nr:plasma-membrane choline transporter-domain-containing protein [Cladochytrium replicatum]